MNEAIIGNCEVVYDGSEPFDTPFPDLSRALEAIFTPGEKFMVGGGKVDLRLWHDLGADKNVHIGIVIRKDGVDLLTVNLPDRYAIDALRRYCEMILAHNRQLDIEHPPER